MAGGAEEHVNQDAEREHPDDVAQVTILDVLEQFLGQGQAAHESSRRQSDQRAEQSEQNQRVERRGMLRGKKFRRDGERRMNTEVDAADEGGRAVASATGRNVRALSSGIINSIANITPPIGVLKVAAMPAPAPRRPG